MSITQLIAREVDTLLYDQLHTLLKNIAADYDLNHGELVEKYLIKCRDDPAPQIIYKSTESVDDEPKRKKRDPSTIKKVKKVKESKDSESDSEKSTKVKCKGTTKAGNPCKNNPFAGGCFCRVHTVKEGDEKKEKKEKKETNKEKRVKKSKEPKHAHGIEDDCSSECPLVYQPAPCKKIPELSIADDKMQKIAAYFSEALNCEVAVDDVTDDMVAEYEVDQSMEQKEGSEYTPSAESEDEAAAESDLE
jgi:hypothetical protein